MALRRQAMECAVRILAAPRRRRCAPVPIDPGTLFVLRNNDIGDLLVVTPLFEALKRRFPRARVIAGIGDWNLDVVRGNPHIDAVARVNAPWHNGKVCRHPWNSGRGLLDALAYICLSTEARALRALRADVGIDVLGSPQGALLLARACIPFRIGVRGYAGGDSAMHACVEFDPDTYVGRSALRFTGLLGLAEKDWPELRPQIYLSTDELENGARHWEAIAPERNRTRLIVGPGAGAPAKRWSMQGFKETISLMTQRARVSVAIVGPATDRTDCQWLADGMPATVNFAGRVDLRQTFALAASADVVLANSSMLMHAAAAFQKRCAVVLGPAFNSARAHARLWSCNPDAAVFGVEPGAAREPSPGDVAHWLLGNR